MTEPHRTSFDEMPYLGQAYPQTHPDRLAVMAKLFGMAPAPLTGCRVLELGCADGANLIPMAEQMPDASFVGLDLSSRQVAHGQAVIAELGLPNIEMRQSGLVDVDESLGKFDYIIAHGVYSWVPREVQDKVLAICNENLAPNGVAYVSYNTYPGWSMRGMVRDMMLYHARQFGEMSLQVQQARALLDFMAENVPTENNPFGILLKQELDGRRNEPDWYLAHEHLVDVNEPLYFHQFAERAAGHGLQYLGEAEFHTMLASNFPPQVTETLRKIAPDIIRLEQYMDFLRNRIFRQTLLVHQGMPLNRKLEWRTMEGFHFASAARPVAGTPDLRSAAVEQFRAPHGPTLSTPNSIVKAAMMILAERWPQAMSFADLRAAARSRVDNNLLSVPYAATVALDAEVLGTDLLQCLAVGVVELRMRSPRLAMQAGERPKASPLARLQAEKGSPVTNLRHETVIPDEFNRQLLRHLDGRRDRSTLLEVLAELVSRDVLAVQRQGQPVQETAAVRAILSEALDENLGKLAQAALLVQ
jgi:methyltransferase-like protein/2-polyprenyl-3-methyl-5-hydroxy-6-metoxy-1,4-benzoquinol methylase